VAFACSNLTAYPYWDGSSGFPFPAGFVTVHDPEGPGNELVYMRAYTCDLTQVAAGDSPLPSILTLLPPSPNPARGIVFLAFSLPEPSVADLALFDVRGRKVADLFHDRPVEAGEGSVSYDASHLPSGIYFLNLKTPAHSLTRKLVVAN
jgi:hypothetical protein